MNPGDRVCLAKSKDWEGSVVRVRGEQVHVAFDGGGTGTLDRSDLAPVEDKAWPPNGLETKTPTGMDTK